MTGVTGVTGVTGRSVTARVTYGEEDFGTVGPFDVQSPWWADVEPVVDHVRAVLGVDVVVLRLVDVDGGTPPRGGHVTYHVETLRRPATRTPVGVAPDTGTVPGRAAWATAAGVRAALRWAGATDRVEQVKTWNLSALFRIPTGERPVWLKLTPPFAAHEPAVTEHIAAVDPTLVVPVLASDPANRRALMAHVPGEDCWDASGELIRATVTRWVAAQAALARGGTPPASTVPDRRPAGLVEGLRSLLDGPAGAQLTGGEAAGARDLLRRLPDMIDELDACGLPYTLVHGDFHPGNWRSDGDATVLIDFADAYVGHPAFDGERLRDFLEPERQPAVVDAWCEAWTEQVPGSDPARALRIARPLQAVAGSILYQMFLDHIEPSERRYHELDPPAGIRAALAATG
ncbi:MAG TPA: aminoglycoside phosphotransferase family protein [Micromonosporaceae bacterium]